ncbi:peptide ligase PGM1-related protein [Thermaurantiacus sp.]
MDEDEREAFPALKAQLAASFHRIFDDPLAPRSVLVVPSLSFDEEILAKVTGAHHYEERMLCLLLLLRYPRAQLIYVTSTPVAPAIIDYYLHLLPGVPAAHARQRLTLLSCEDRTPQPLTAKLLARPRLIERIRASIPDPRSAHMSCFTVTALERALALRLGIPIYGCDPDLLAWGSKSGSRKLFREAGVPIADGFEDLGSMDEVAEALAELRHRRPGLRRAVVKLNEGFSGEGNAVFDFGQRAGEEAPVAWVRDHLRQLCFEARDMTFDSFAAKLGAMGGIVEEWVEGEHKMSPSAQLRVDPTGHLAAVSTHDQLLGGGHGQIFLGCRFPADPAYRLDIQALAMKAGARLADKGVVGRFSVDFVSVETEGRWEHKAIEVNLRKGGTTHPFIMLQFLTDGRYDPATGDFLTPSGRPCFYTASDNLESAAYRGLTPDDLIDISVMNGLHFHAAAAEGVAFHMIGALSEFGKLGVTCIGNSPARAESLFAETVAVLNRETAQG